MNIVIISTVVVVQPVFFGLTSTSHLLFFHRQLTELLFVCLQVKPYFIRKGPLRPRTNPTAVPKTAAVAVVATAYHPHYPAHGGKSGILAKTHFHLRHCQSNCQFSLSSLLLPLHSLAAVDTFDKHPLTLTSQLTLASISHFSCKPSFVLRQMLCLTGGSRPDQFFGPTSLPLLCSTQLSGLSQNLLDPVALWLHTSPLVLRRTPEV